MLFNVLLQELLNTYNTQRASLTYNMPFASSLRENFITELNLHIDTRNTDIFYIPREIQDQYICNNSIPFLLPMPQNTMPSREIERLLAKNRLPESALQQLQPAILLQNQRLRTLHLYFKQNICPIYLNSENKPKIINALKLLTNPGDHAYGWQKNKCDAIYLLMDVIENIPSPILGEIVILYQQKQIATSSPKTIMLGLQFGTLIEQITAPHLEQIRSGKKNPYDIFARYFWDSYFVHFYPNHIPQIEIAITALKNLSDALNFYAGPLEAQTNITAMNIGACKAAFEVLLDEKSSQQYIQGPGYAQHFASQKENR